VCYSLWYNAPTMLPATGRQHRGCRLSYKFLCAISRLLSLPACHFQVNLSLPVCHFQVNLSLSVCHFQVKLLFPVCHFQVITSSVPFPGCYHFLSAISKLLSLPVCHLQVKLSLPVCHF